MALALSFCVDVFYKILVNNCLNVTSTNTKIFKSAATVKFDTSKGIHIEEAETAAPPHAKDSVEHNVMKLQHMLQFEKVANILNMKHTQLKCQGVSLFICSYSGFTLNLKQFKPFLWRKIHFKVTYETYFKVSGPSQRTLIMVTER